jgi:hypothetical protein
MNSESNSEEEDSVSPGLRDSDQDVGQSDSVKPRHRH